MKTILYIIFAYFLLYAFSWGQENMIVGFEDTDHNGVNDHFADADGDGMNDVDGRPYEHTFQFQDKNKDGKNDLWADADGDGVNDLLSHFQKKAWIDINGDGIQDEGTGVLRGQALKKHVLDTNQDNINDITGERITSTSLGGYKLGRVNEENGMPDRGFLGNDGDRMNDRSAAGVSENQRGRDMDVFIDQDGDGIADGRGLGRFKTKQRGKNNQ
ncbi:hypothetical protein JW835_16880 [bacterium]|nr:hypothetical protein [bacterium]